MHFTPTLYHGFLGDWCTSKRNDLFICSEVLDHLFPGVDKNRSIRLGISEKKQGGSVPLQFYEGTDGLYVNVPGYTDEDGSGGEWLYPELAVFIKDQGLLPNHTYHIDLRYVD